MIICIHDLIEVLKINPPKIILASNLHDWLLKSDWDCVLSDRLKKYIRQGGTVERKEVSE